MHKKVHSIHIYACMLSWATKPRCNYLLHCTLRRLLNIDAVRTTATRTSRWRLTNCAAGLTDERVDGGRTRCNSNLPVCVCVCVWRTNNKTCRMPRPQSGALMERNVMLHGRQAAMYLSAAFIATFLVSSLQCFVVLYVHSQLLFFFAFALHTYTHVPLLHSVCRTAQCSSVCMRVYVCLKVYVCLFCVVFVYFCIFFLCFVFIKKSTFAHFRLGSAYDGDSFLIDCTSMCVQPVVVACTLCAKYSDWFKCLCCYHCCCCYSCCFKCPGLLRAAARCCVK